MLRGLGAVEVKIAIWYTGRPCGDSSGYQIAILHCCSPLCWHRIPGSGALGLGVAPGGGFRWGGARSRCGGTGRGRDRFGAGTAGAGFGCRGRRGRCAGLFAGPWLPWASVVRVVRAWFQRSGSGMFSSRRWLARSRRAVARALAVGSWDSASRRLARSSRRSRRRDSGSAAPDCRASRSVASRTSRSGAGGGGGVSSSSASIQAPPPLVSPRTGGGADGAVPKRPVVSGRIRALAKRIGPPGAGMPAGGPDWNGDAAGIANDIGIIGALPAGPAAAASRRAARPAGSPGAACRRR